MEAITPAPVPGIATLVGAPISGARCKAVIEFELGDNGDTCGVVRTLNQNAW